jgi:hypothetical protein
MSETDVLPSPSHSLSAVIGCNAPGVAPPSASQARQRSRASRLSAAIRRRQPPDCCHSLNRLKNRQRFFDGSGFVLSHIKAITSAVSSTTLASGLPPPWPALVSILIRTGLSQA